jgi:hypothetical protein
MRKPGSAWWVELSSVPGTWTWVGSLNLFFYRAGERPRGQLRPAATRPRYRASLEE